MSDFFKATRTASMALYGDFKFKPYYNLGFHLDGISSFFCHLLRTLYDLAALMLRVVITPLCLLNPLAWLSLPNHVLELVDDAVGTVISLVTVVIHPIIFCLRTLTSLFFGYEEGSNCDWGIADEEADLNLAMAVF